MNSDPPPIGDNFSRKFNDIVFVMLNKDPTKRASVTKLLNYLQKRFIPNMSQLDTSTDKSDDQGQKKHKADEILFCIQCQTQATYKCINCQQFFCDNHYRIHMTSPSTLLHFFKIVHQN